jgi:putative addiction module CopG family antidote
MSKMTTLNVRIGGALSDFVAGAIGETGDYDNASEYVRDLIRQDKAKTEHRAFEAKRAALQQAFALPDNAYTSVNLNDVIARNLSKR